MKNVFTALICIVLILNPTLLYAKSVKEKTNFYSIIECEKINDDFSAFVECVEKQSMTSSKLANLKQSKKKEIFDILAVANIINKSVNEGFVNDFEAYINWELFLNSNYKSKSKKNKLKKVLENNPCVNLKDYNKFINCFNNEFRKFDIYQNTNIKTKERMEHIVFNSLVLTQPGGLVATLKKENIFGNNEIDTIYKEGDGYEFFFILMNALGTEYFTKPKYKVESNIEWKKVIKFIVIAIIVAVVAKGLIKTLSKGSSSSGATTSSTGTGTTSVASGCTQVLVARCTSVGWKGLFRNAPARSVLKKPWFKMAFSRGGFF